MHLVRHTLFPHNTRPNHTTTNTNSIATTSPTTPTITTNPLSSRHLSPSLSSSSNSHPTSPPAAAANEHKKASQRQRCAKAILALIPPFIRRLYLGVTTNNEEAQRKVIERGLDVFADDYLNKHLVYAILERCLVRLMPELGVESVEQILTGRGLASLG